MDVAADRGHCGAPAMGAGAAVCGEGVADDKTASTHSSTRCCIAPSSLRERLAIRVARVSRDFVNYCAMVK
jgi:hypothetical protein